ncbi:MAG: transporter substrate-binding domain-containing protein [Desulfamplus sp.]|nr:transporter substrate-binding domain-containing protein [Desulfamplus sp.]
MKYISLIKINLLFILACFNISFAFADISFSAEPSNITTTPSILADDLLTKKHSRVIQAAGDHNYPPYEFLDPNGQPTGFNVDIFRAVCEAMGISYEINLGPWDHVRQKLENGEVDVITGMYFSPERDKKVDFSTPHIIVSHALFVRKDSGINLLEDLSGKEVIVQRGDIMDDFLQSQARSLTIIRVTDQEDALHLLSEGKHECALLSKLQGLYLIHKYKLSGLKAVGTSVQQRDYCFAVREGDQQLVTWLNEGLALIRTRGIYQQIHNKWFGIYEEDEAWQRFMQYLLWASIPVSLIFMGILAWNRMLKYRIELATKALSQSEHKYRDFVALAVDGIALGSPDGVIIEANQVLCEWLDIPHDQLIGRHVSTLPWSPGTLEKTPLRFDLLNSGQVITRVRELERRDGSRIYIEMRSKRMPDGSYQSIFRDITDRIEAEEEKEKLMSQLAQSQKMEAVGRLAGGIAHDFNNMLGVIIGYTDMAMTGLQPGAPFHAEFEGILKAARRSSDLTRQLLAFARKQTIVPKILDLNKSVENMLSMLQRLIGESVDLAWIPSTEELWPVKMDPTQLDQIFANLCVNARDATNGTGKIIIETKNIKISKSYCNLHTEFKPGEYVQLAVSDNGCGMDKETKKHLFEPFFTTKGEGKGTGLGLATVYGIIKQNNGFINAYSEVGQGTTFRIYIPRTCEANIDMATQEVEATSTSSNKEMILLIEDEPMLLELTRLMLETIGYKVLSCAIPEEGIKMAEKHSEEIDLLITDVVMPKMNGRELVEKILEIAPDISYLFISGYTANLIARHGILDKEPHFLQKPFSIDELSKKIRKILDKRQGRSEVLTSGHNES